MKNKLVIVLVFMAAICIFAFAGCKSKTNEVAAEETQQTEEVKLNLAAEGTLPEKVSLSAESLKALEGKEGIFAILQTEKGEIVLELYYKDTPLTVMNFVGLAEGIFTATAGKPYYDGLTFHRVKTDFMIQGGDPYGNGSGGPGYQFPDEIVDKYQFTGPGILAMANAGAGTNALGTNGSQFFITHVETSWLNGQHTIFGCVVKGQDVVNAIEQDDKIIHVEIIRQGNDAENFVVTQAEFDNLRNAAISQRLAMLHNALKEAYPEMTETQEGIFYMTTEEGSGEKVGMGKRVLFNYQGMFLDGSIFDVSQSGPMEMNTGLGTVIKGMDMMIQDMKVGETRAMILPPDLAYGQRGAGSTIPGNCYLIFLVQVVSAQ